MFNPETRGRKRQKIVDEQGDTVSEPSDWERLPAPRRARKRYDLQVKKNPAYAHKKKDIRNQKKTCENKRRGGKKVKLAEPKKAPKKLTMKLKLSLAIGALRRSREENEVMYSLSSSLKHISTCTQERGAKKEVETEVWMFNDRFDIYSSTYIHPHSVFVGNCMLRIVYPHNEFVLLSEKLAKSHC